MARWLVERTQDRFEDVGAVSIALHPSGALVFYDKEHEVEIAYAPGQWITVCPDEVNG